LGIYFESENCYYCSDKFHKAQNAAGCVRIPSVEKYTMNFKDKTIHDIIERLKSQYQLFTGNQFINYYLNESNIPKNDWMDIEDLINSNRYFEAEGYDLEKLYEQIRTFSLFLTKIKEEVLSKITQDSKRRMAQLSSDNRVLYKMTIDNTPGNLKIFYDIIIELYLNLKKIDQKANGEDNMILARLPFAADIEKTLNQ